MTSSRASIGLRMFGSMLFMAVLLQSAMGWSQKTQPPSAQKKSSGSADLSKEEKSYTVQINDLLGASGPVTIQIIPGEQKDIDEVDGPTKPAKACVSGKSASSCYTAQDSDYKYARNVQTSLVSTGEGHSVLLMSASYLTVTEEVKSVVVLGMNADGKLLNLLAPVRLPELGGQYRLWDDKLISPGQILTAAKRIWATPEGHFDSHRYRVTTYAFCPTARRYVAVDTFRTQKKFPSESTQKPGDVVLDVVMTLVKERLMKRSSKLTQCGGK